MFKNDQQKPIIIPMETSPEEIKNEPISTLPINDEAMFPFIDQSIPYDDIMNKTFLYHPGIGQVMSETPFEPFNAVCKENFDLIVEYGKNMKFDKNKNDDFESAISSPIANQYIVSNMMNNICIVLNTGLFAEIKKYIKKEEWAIKVFSYNSEQWFTKLERQIFQWVGYFEHDYGKYSQVPNYTFPIIGRMTYCVEDFIRQCINSNIINMTAFNEFLLSYLYHGKKKNIPNTFDMANDPSFIISYLHMIGTNDLNKISELLEFSLVSGANMGVKMNNTLIDNGFGYVIDKYGEQNLPI